MDKFNEDRIKQLLVKHLMKNLDEAETQELELWRKLSPHNEELYMRMSDSTYLGKRYEDFRKVSGIKEKHSEKKKDSRVFRWWLLSATVAAAAVLLFISIPYLFKTEMVTFTAPNKEVAHLVLPDGSNVWLKSSSQIIYPAKFKRGKREVSLSGEGYFEVTPSSDAFVVETDGFKVKVTGTKFDINSYRDENQAITALIEGEVTIIYSDSSGVIREDKMVGGDLAVFDKASRNNTILKTNTSIYSSWIDGVYYFESEKLEVILREVCRYYGYNLIISDGSIKDKVLSGRLKMGEDAKTIIESFQEFLPGHIKLESDTIIIQ